MRDGCSTGWTVAPTDESGRADRAARRRRWMLWIGLAAVAAVRFLFAAYVPLLPKEAMFWQWARHGLTSGAPAPVLVWGIAAGTGLLGQTALGVRLLPLTAGLFGILAAYRAAWCWTESRQAATTAAVLTAVVPLLAGLSILAVPVSLLVVCHLVGLDGLGRIIRHGRAAGWYLLALALALGVWSTPTGVVLLPLLVFAAVMPRGKRVRPLDGRGAAPFSWWRSAHPYAAAALFVAATAPWWWWEVHHNWRLSCLAWSWRSHADAGAGRNLLEFVGEQMIGLSPPLLVAAVLALGAWPGSTRPYRRLWLVLVSVPFLVVAALSIRVQTHPEWPVLAYPPLVLAVGAGAAGRTAVRRWVSITVRFMIGVFVLLALAVPASAWLMGRLSGHRRLQHKLAQVVLCQSGFRDMARTVDSHYRRLPEPRPFVFGQQAHFTAPLALHWAGGPYVYTFQAAMRPEVRTGRYSTLWEDHTALVGRDGLFVTDFFTPHTRTTLEGLFDRVDSPQELVVWVGRVPVKRYHIALCHRFKGERGVRSSRRRGRRPHRRRPPPGPA